MGKIWDRNPSVAGMKKTNDHAKRT